MAAAAEPRSRGVAGGLYFLFTLMCLVCLSSSLIDKNKLAIIKGNIPKIQQKLDEVKAQKTIISETVSEYMRIIYPVMAFLKETAEGSPDDFLTLERNIENIEGLMEKTKTFVDEQNKKMDAEIEKTEQELRTMKKIIKAVEEKHGDL